MKDRKKINYVKSVFILKEDIATKDILKGKDQIIICVTGILFTEKNNWRIICIR